MLIASPVTAETRETLWRTLQTFSFTRIVIAGVLLVYLSFNTKQGFDQGIEFVDWKTCAAYLASAFAFAALTIYFQRRYILQLITQIAVDVAAISLLYVAAGGAKSGLAILYLFPLAGCAILAPLVLALFFAALVTIVMLGEAGYQLISSSPEAAISRAGLYGAAFFAAAYVINRLAARLIKQENLAMQRGRDLRIQEAINRLVIADMGDGILVVGSDGRIFATNPAAERMLGLAVPYGRPRYKLDELPPLAPIADAYSAWNSEVGEQKEGNADWSTFVVVKPREELATLQGSTIAREARRELASHLKLRFAKVETRDLGEERAVIFLQDVTEIENQAQQLKLASMGRLTASIAHEVRNPLSAISHAASLLVEEITEPVQSRLLTIIGDNVRRLNRMIEDILKLSRKAQTQAEPLVLAPFCNELLTEFRETHGVGPDMIHLGDMTGYQVRFDPLHLREVLVNLLSNALRYASPGPGSIRIHALADNASRLELHVQDDGPAITPAVRAHLFEPFYTTSSKGTGLGLYVARELCLNNGAMLDYEYRTDVPHAGQEKPTGRFVITFAMPARA